MNSRKIVAILVTVVMVFGSFAVSFADDTAAATTAASNTTFTDITGHWGSAAIEKWAGYGIISGFEGLFRPDDPITRGEMAVILDNMMDYQLASKNSFWDLQADQFYTDAVLKANAAGIIKGYDGSVRPADKITKEEAAVMMSRAFAVTEASATKAFLDASAVSDWAKGAVFGMEAKGFVSGFDGYFNPKANITRAEAVTMINNIVKAYYTTAGTYTDNVDGTAVIKVADVTLKGVTVTGNLIIAEGVGQGDAYLDSVTIKGDTVVRGGGENSIHITGTSSVTKITIEKVGDKIRIVVDDGVNVPEVQVVAANEEIIITGTVGTVDVNASDATVYATAAEIKTANIAGDNSKIVVGDKSTVDNITVASTAKNTSIQAETGSVVKAVTASAEISVSGTGTVTNVTLKEGANGSSITTPKTVTTVGSGVTDVTGGGGAAIPAGSTGTNSNTGTSATVTTTNNNGGGGGGGGGSHNDPTFTFGDITVTGASANTVPQTWTGSTTMSAVVSGTNLAGKTLTVEVSATVSPSGVTITRSYDYTVNASPSTASAITFNDSSNNAADFVSGFNSVPLLADWNTLKALDLTNDTITITVKYSGSTLATKTLTIIY